MGRGTTYHHLDESVFKNVNRLLMSARDRCMLELEDCCESVAEAEKQASCEAAAIWIGEAMRALGMEVD